MAGLVPISCFIASLFVPSPRAQLILWGISLLIELGAIFATAYIPPLFIPLNIEHITERFGLFMIIILGEDILNLIFLEKGNFWWQDYLIVTMGLVVTFGFQLLYYDIEESHRLRKAHAFRRTKQAGQIWFVLHLLYAASVPILAIGISIALEQSTQPGGPPIEVASHKRAVEAESAPTTVATGDYWVVTPELKPSFMKWYYAGGFAMSFVSLALIGILHEWSWSRERIPKPARVVVRLCSGLAPIAMALLSDDIVLIMGLTTIIMVCNCVMELLGARLRSGLSRTLSDAADGDLNLDADADSANLQTPRIAVSARGGGSKHKRGRSLDFLA